MTDTTTPKFDPIPRLQQIAATIEESGADIFDAPATAVHYIECAIKEIERLREALRLEQEELAACCIDRKETQRERDEARREVCRMVSDADERSKPESPEQIADRREWNCFNAPEHKLVKTLNGIITNKGKATPPQYLQDLG